MERKSGAKWRKAMIEILVTASIAVTVVCFALMLAGKPGMNIAFCFTLVLSSLVIVFSLIHMLRSKEKYTKIALILQRCFMACLAIGTAVFILLQGLILSAGRTEDADVDCLIILGAGLFGEIPSSTLASRLDSAIEYLNGRDDIPVIVSGGQGPGETITEAEAMSRYLKRKGVNENQIWKEGSSTSTLENLEFSTALMEDSGLDTKSLTIAIVTNEFHLYRAKHIAGKMGLSTVGVAAETPYLGLRVLYHIREAAAILNCFVFGSSK
ncbi:MAG: YdcF family protein [Oscillospiraceae bacterium]|nr:YdcF family protein [Oscillospiraceae bacterium]